MILSELLERLRRDLPACGQYTVVAGPRPDADAAPTEDAYYPVVAVFADDDAEEVVLQLSEAPLPDVEDAERVTLEDLAALLETHASCRGRFEIETSSSGPEDDFRVDFPVAGTGRGDDTQVFALLW